MSMTVRSVLCLNTFTVGLLPEIIQLNGIYFYVRLLTLSSSAVRFGVRFGACGTLGSLPRPGGKGSRGKPLHISFREDILCFLSHT